MWPRVNGMRTFELGTPGPLRDELNALVLAGLKTATTGLVSEYTDASEELDHVGEREVLVDSQGQALAVIEVITVELTTFAEVTWEHAAAEGEGDACLDDWRTSHQRYWARVGTPVHDGTAVVCVTFRVIESL